MGPGCDPVRSGVLACDGAEVPLRSAAKATEAAESSKSAEAKSAEAESEPAPGESGTACDANATCGAPESWDTSWSGLRDGSEREQ